MRGIIIALFAVLFGSTLQAQTEVMQSSVGPVKVTQIASGLRGPWAVAILPGGKFLITEKNGKLWLFDGQGGKRRISGTPSVAVKKQGGLLDVVAARDFARSKEIFLTFAKPQPGGAGTALAVARLDEAADTLRNFRVIFELARGSKGGRHFGSRVVEAPDGTLFLTIGDRGDRPSAQDLSRQNGSVVRVTRSGGVPGGNPFAGQTGAQPEIWSYGHRNAQGAALDASGNLWTVEHGARGGDEVNRIRKGRNYGWPVISYGKHYRGGKIGVGTHKAGMEQPGFYWDPSIAPSGMMIYSGKMFPEWKGDIFVGSLKFDHIARLDRRGDRLTAGEILETRATKRVRDVREAPDGSIWFLSEDRSGLFRISR